MRDRLKSLCEVSLGPTGIKLYLIAQVTEVFMWSIHTHHLYWLDHPFGLLTHGILVKFHTHTVLMALCLGLPGWTGTRKVKPIWIFLKQQRVSGSGIHWAIRKSAPRSRQITMPATHHSVFYRPDALPTAQSTASKHWRDIIRNVLELQHFCNCFCLPSLHTRCRR